jgi:serine/threonine protein kinase
MYTAQVLDAGPDADPPWLATAYVSGPSLHQAVSEHGPMPEQTVFALVAGVAEALAAIHGAGIVHRDLKPSNVLLAPDGPRVIDFGIARAADATVLTRKGTLIGSPPFMAPEQVTGATVTPATDVFALGSLAVFAASGAGRRTAPDGTVWTEVINGTATMHASTSNHTMTFGQIQVTPSATYKLYKDGVHNADGPMTVSTKANAYACSPTTLHLSWSNGSSVYTRVR